MQIELVTVGIIAFIITLLSLPIIRIFALRMGLYDEIEDRKVHKSLTPRIGGVSIALALVVNILLFVDLSRPAIALMLAAITLFITGMIDDLFGLKPITKLLAQIVAAIFVLSGGISILFFNLPFSSALIFLDTWKIPVEIFNLSFT